MPRTPTVAMTRRPIDTRLGTKWLSEAPKTIPKPGYCCLCGATAEQRLYDSVISVGPVAGTPALPVTFGFNDAQSGLDVYYPTSVSFPSSSHDRMAAIGLTGGGDAGVHKVASTSSRAGITDSELILLPNGLLIHGVL